MKKISKKWKIIITAVVILIGSFYGYYKANNRNAFEEMYNSYYDILPIASIDRMGQIEPMRKDKRGIDVVTLEYKNNTKDKKIGILLIRRDEEIIVTSSILVEEGIHIGISYTYNMNSHRLINDVGIHGKNVPTVEDKVKQTKELLEKYNISKEYLQEKSDELLNTVLTDWKRYSGSSYSKDNMGRLTIEQHEFLR